MTRHIAGNLDVFGDLVVSGTITPDYVFTSAYALESIEVHAAYMWENKHLPAVGAGQTNAQGQRLINVGARMLEELEKAHIYIEQLHGEMGALKSEDDHKGKQIETLRREMTANENHLKALKDEKDAQIEMLKGEMTALKALVHQQLVQHRNRTPGKES